MAEESEVTSDEAISSLFRARKTVFKMLEQRQYLVHDDEKNQDKNTFITNFRDGDHGINKNLLTIMVRKIDDSDVFIMVFFPSEDTVGVDPIRRYYKTMQEENVKRAILVVKEKLTPSAKTALAGLPADCNVEYFKEEELLVDITEHELVPEHKLLSEGDKQALLARYKLNQSQLPRMQKNDPISRYFGLQRGDVVKIIRSSETAGRYVTYRTVN